MATKANGDHLEGVFIPPAVVNPVFTSVAMHPMNFSLRDQTHSDFSNVVEPNTVRDSD